MQPGGPRHGRRVTATCQAWFTAGKLLEHVEGRTGGRACAQVRNNLRARLRAVRTSVNLAAQPHAV